MYRQLLFCVEADKKSNSDFVYISEILKHFYSYDNNKVSVKCINMGSKYNYNRSKIIKEISSRIRQFRGETNVFICVDTDNIQGKYEDKKKIEEIDDYCKLKGFELIWFCRDIEEVCWGKHIADDIKVKEAGRFRRKNIIKNLETKKLESNNHNKENSNALLVLDQYLERSKIGD